MSGRWRLLAAAVLAGVPLAAGATMSGAQAGPPAADAAIDPATIPMPNLAFTPTPAIEANYDKYYVFNRAGTDFATAYADLTECDGYARGFNYRVNGGGVGYPYAGMLGGVVGGVIGDVVSDALYGSAERRRMRRYNMRTCMGFKGYRIYGLPKALWEPFNFEEGNGRVEEGERRRMLRIQARVASGPAPQVGEIRE